MQPLKNLKAAALLLAIVALQCSISAFSQSRIEVLDSIALPQDYILDLNAAGSGYEGLATIRAEGSLCGGKTAWMELDSKGQVLRCTPLILKNGKGTSAYQYFKVGQDLYTFHPNTSTTLYHWDKDIREVDAIQIQFPDHKNRYHLTMHQPLQLSSEAGKARLVCTAERYYKKSKQSDLLGPYDWNGPSMAILEVSPEGDKVAARLFGGHPTYYKEGFTSYRHLVRSCIGPQDQVIQGFAMGGPLSVYNPSGERIDSLPCPSLPIPEGEKHVWMDKIHTVHFFALQDMYSYIHYDAESDCYLAHKSYRADKSVADSILAANDYLGLSKLTAQRRTELEVIKRQGHQTIANVQYPFPSPKLMRSQGNEIWVQSGLKIYHCRIVIEREKI
ncbi:MAG: hypothetical protein U0176_11410 [Bacteroidia bacterium]